MNLMFTALIILEQTKPKAASLFLAVEVYITGGGYIATCQDYTSGVCIPW